MRVRERQIKIYTTFEEYKDIKQRADKSGLTMSDYIRNRSIGYELKEKPPLEFYEALKQIRAVGNNLNQIARLANATGIIDELSYKKQYDELNNLIIDIKKKYLLPELELPLDIVK